MRTKFMNFYATVLFCLLCLGVSASQSQPQGWIDAALKIQTQATLYARELPFTSPLMGLGEQARYVDVDIAGLESLTLITDCTEDGRSQDFAVWGNAVLVDKDGKEYKLQNEKFTHKGDNNWITKGMNIRRKPLTIKGKVYEHGIFAHAANALTFDIKGRGFVRFKSYYGIDDMGGGLASVIFKIQGSDGSKEVEQLKKVKPQALDYFNEKGLSAEQWITTYSVGYQKFVVGELAVDFTTMDAVNKKMAAMDAIKSPKAKHLAYFEFIDQIKMISTLRKDIAWLNIKAIKAAYKDFSKGKNLKDAELKELEAIVAKYKDSWDKLFCLDEAVIAAAQRAVELKRVILMSNPLLDFEEILVTKYNFEAGEGKRATARELGTSNDNFSSLMSSKRDGYNAEIVALSGWKNNGIKTRNIFKPENDGLITEADLNWDGERVLFTATNKNKQFQLYEAKVDGSGSKQITNLPDTDVEFFDAAYLPNGKIVSASNVGYNGVPCVSGNDIVSTYTLYDPATNQMRRLTFDQDCNWSASMLANGKVMFTRWEYTDMMHYYSRIVMFMNPDGTEQKAYFGSGAMFPNATYDMQQLPTNTNRFIGVISGHHGVVRAGRLMIFDPTVARKGVEGIVQELPFSEREVIPVVKDSLVNGVWPQFMTPQPISDNYFLTAGKMSPKSPWGIYMIDIFDNLTEIHVDENIGYINAIPVRKRTAPTVVPEKVPMDLSKEDMSATVFIQDIYEGEGLEGVKRGTVKNIRVMSYDFAYLYTTADHLNNGIQSGWDIKRELGVVPVYEDGSALFKIPANMPISLQPLDENGAAIQLMRSWLVGMPGEVVSCVGCHENLNIAAKPKLAIASRKEPVLIKEPLGGVRPMAYETEIQPILDRACIACHNTEKKAGGKDFTKGRMREITYNRRHKYEYSEAYLDFHPYFHRQGPEAEMAVLTPYDYHVDNSEMIQMLRKGHHGVELTAHEWNRLITWVDFNMPYAGVFRANPYAALDGTTYDQKARRIELSKKYANMAIEWEKELNDFKAFQAKQGAVKTEMPVQTKVNVKQVKVKGYPFTAEKAKAMVEGKEPRVVDLGNGVKMTFVYIPAGSFVAGGSGVKGQLAPSKVKIKQGFWIAQNEVSNAQMRALVPDHSSRYIRQQWKDHTRPGYFVDEDHLPATKVSWEKADEFTKKLSAKLSQNVALPTEQQWEWAARAGSDKDFWFGSASEDFSKYENLADKSLDQMAVSGVDPTPMSESDPLFETQAYIPKDRSINDGNMLMATSGSYQANPWGVYDINGNVAEWTSTKFDDVNYVVKGGSWYDRAKKVTVSDRRSFTPWHRVWNVGFRPVILE